MSFNLKKKKFKNKSIEYIEDEGFKYSSKKSNLKLELTIYNYNIIEGLIIGGFNKKYKTILKMIIRAIPDDDNDSSNLNIALDELAKLKYLIMTKFEKFLKNETERTLLKKLSFLEKEAKAKLVEFNLIKEEKLAYTNKAEEKSVKNR